MLIKILNIAFTIIIIIVTIGCKTENIKNKTQSENHELIKNNCTNIFTFKEYEKDIKKVLSKFAFKENEINVYIYLIKKRYKEGDKICKYLYGSFAHMTGRMGYAIFRNDVLIYNVVVLMN